MVRAKTVVCREGKSIFYKAQRDIEVPNVDFLSYVFDHCSAGEDTVLHCDASRPELSLTKSELRGLAKNIGFTLRHRFGIRPGQAVTCIASGSYMAPSVFLGCVVAEAVFCAASPSSTVAELVRVLQIADSHLIVCSEDTSGIAIRAAQEQGMSSDQILVIDPDRRTLKAYSSGLEVLEGGGSLEWARSKDPEYLQTTMIALIFSSGTTGLPKGTPITHGNMIAQAVTTWALMREEIMDETPDFRFSSLAHLPFAHIAGLMLYFVAPFIMDGVTYWMPKFTFADMIEYHRRHQITFCVTVPPICLLIANSKDVDNHFDSVAFMVAAAAPMGKDLQIAASKKLGGGRTMITQSYGMSEVAGCVTLLAYKDVDLTGSVGRLVPTFTARLVDDNDRDIEPGQEGELLLKGPAVFRGYHKASGTEDTFTREGWYRTGDMLRFQDGLFYVTDRKKEMIKYKGLQVAPAELEALLMSHPGVQDAAVIGVEGEGTELPRAYIIRKAAELSAEDVAAYVKAKVSGYKQLRGGVVFVESIPKLASGKILKRELREMSRRELNIARKL